jgi:hypothetical protein
LAKRVDRKVAKAYFGVAAGRSVFVIDAASDTGLKTERRDDDNEIQHRREITAKSNSLYGFAFYIWSALNNPGCGY